jgi:hypothetical protein
VSRRACSHSSQPMLYQTRHSAKQQTPTPSPAPSNRKRKEPEEPETDFPANTSSSPNQRHKDGPTQNGYHLRSRPQSDKNRPLWQASKSRVVTQAAPPALTSGALPTGTRGGEAKSHRYKLTVRYKLIAVQTAAVQTHCEVHILSHPTDNMNPSDLV